MDFEHNILITSSGRRVELVKAFIASRNRLGLKGKVICADADITAPTAAFADKAIQIPRINTPEYIDTLKQILIDERIALLIPTIDTELQTLADAKAELEETTGAKILISDAELIALCRDKEKTAKYLTQFGILAPTTYTLKDALEREIYPLFIKPRDGSSSIGAYKVKSSHELEFFASYVASPVIQDYLEGEEYSVDAFSDLESKIISIVPRKRLAVRGGEILKGQIDLNEKIIASVRELLDRLKPIGPITLQGFLSKDQDFYYTEINPRYGGGAPMSFAAGADSTEWLWRIIAGLQIPTVTIKDKAIYSRFDQTVEI